MNRYLPAFLAALLATGVASADTYRISLASNQGPFVSAAGGGGGNLTANRTAIGPWESFTLTDVNGGRLMSGDTVYLQVSNGNYWAAEFGGGSTLVANRTSVGQWEAFTIHNTAGGTEINSGDPVALRTSGGSYVVAVWGGGTPDALLADRTSIGPWETFRYIVQFDLADYVAGDSSDFRVLSKMESNGAIEEFSHVGGTPLDGLQRHFFVKSSDGRNWEEFGFDGQFVYRYRDTSWGVTCDNQPSAKAYYGLIDSDRTKFSRWGARYMYVGQTWTSPVDSRVDAGYLNWNNGQRIVCDFGCTSRYEGGIGFRKLRIASYSRWYTSLWGYTVPDVIEVVDESNHDHFWFSKTFGMVAFQGDNPSDPAHPYRSGVFDIRTGSAAPNRMLLCDEGGTCDRNNYPANAWNACVFDGTDPSQAVCAGTEQWAAALDKSWDTGGPLGRTGNFAVEARGTFNFPACRYVFHTLSDDGVQLDIQADGSNEIDNWTDHSETQNDSAALQLSGNVRIVVRYYERTGGARLKVWWEQLPSNTAPIGWAGFSSPGIVEGWALDPDTGAQSIGVHFYAAAPSGAFTFIGSTTANIPRGDVNSATGYPGDHGYRWVIPAQYRDNQQYQLYVYALDTAGGTNPLLQGDPTMPLPFKLAPNRRPVGSYSITSTGVVQGWSADPDTGSQSINVHFYAVTPSGAFTFIGGTSANLAWANTGYPGNHGFQWTIPSQYRNGQLYKLYAYGLDTSGLGENGELTGSPQTPVPFQLSQ